MIYRIYRIHVIGNKAWRTEDIIKDDVEMEEFRKEIADTFKTSPSKVKFQYDSDEEWEDK